jgi:integrase
MGRERKGTILERNNKIYARVRFKDENGKQRDLWRVAENKADARKKIKELVKESESLSAKELDSANMTLNELADYYIKNYLHKAVYIGDKKVSGVRGVTEAICAVKPLKEYFGTRKIKTITDGDIRTYKQFRLSTPTKYGNQRAIATVNKELNKLKRMFNIAVREQWLSRNVFSNGESLISQEEHRTRVLSIDEEKRLLVAIESNPRRSHIKGIVLIGLDCALRRGEIFSLKWSDVDFVARTITVRAFNAKTARKRTTAMTKRVYAELYLLWENSIKDENELVFGVSVTIKTAWKKICREADIEDFHFHDTRHTAITRMIRAGLPPVEIMKVSGHSTLSAFNIYANLESDAIFRAANALDNYLAIQHSREDSSRNILDLVN